MLYRPELQVNSIADVRFYRGYILSIIPYTLGEKFNFYFSEIIILSPLSSVYISQQGKILTTSDCLHSDNQLYYCIC